MRFSLLTVVFGLGFTVASAQHWELRYLKGLEANRNAAKNDFYVGLSKSAPPLCVATPAALFLTSYATDNPELRYMSVTGGIGLAATIAETYALKTLINRKRPYKKYAGQLSPLLSKSTASFPSGHTSTAFYTATWLTLEKPKWYVAVPSYLWAGLVAHSRNYTGVHYLTDVLAGAALGSATAYGVWRLRRR